MGSSRSMAPDNAKITWWILVSIVGVAFGIHLWGIRQNLPFVPEIDEPVFVTRAVRLAASGDLNPGWFGNPGSTAMYPLAALYRTWHAVVHRGMLFHPDPRCGSVRHVGVVHSSMIVSSETCCLMLRI
jgi:hypothetical protein